MAKILIVEDDVSIRVMIKMHLSLVGHIVFEAEDASSAHKILCQEIIDLAILDIMLPGEDGFSIGEKLIAEGMSVLFLTARTAVSDRVRGLTMGAEDYILKPFEPAELLARIENILKRNQKEEDKFKTGDIEIDFKARRVFLREEEIILTALEFDLLSMLARRRNIAVSRDELLSAVWGYNYLGETRTVDVHVQRLRAKIGAEYIETVYKYGYRFSGRQ